VAKSGRLHRHWNEERGLEPEGNALPVLQISDDLVSKLVDVRGTDQ
jgi:hypothetical protein